MSSEIGSEIETLMEFKKQLIIFLDELCGQFPNEGDLIVFRLFITNQIDINIVMETVNYKLNSNGGEIKQMISDRNERFFIDYSLFGECTTDNVTKINHFKKLWLSGNMDEDDKEVLWNWIDVFVFLADKYTKQKISQ